MWESAGSTQSSILFLGLELGSAPQARLQAPSLSHLRGATSGSRVSLTPLEPPAWRGALLTSTLPYEKGKQATYSFSTGLIILLRFEDVTILKHEDVQKM